MSGSDAKSVREHLDTAAVEGAAIDEPQRSFHGGARSLPSRREGGRLRSAPQARPKSRRLGCGRRGKEANVASKSRSNRAHGPAVNAGRSDTRKEAPVVAAILGHAGALAFLCIEHCSLALVLTFADGVRIRRAGIRSGCYLQMRAPAMGPRHDPLPPVSETQVARFGADPRGFSRQMRKS